MYRSSISDPVSKPSYGRSLVESNRKEESIPMNSLDKLTTARNSYALCHFLPESDYDKRTGEAELLECSREMHAEGKEGEQT